MQELSLNILDIAQNSIRADARLVEICVDEDTVRDTFTITIRDDGCGMTEEQVQRVTDPFFTTRNTRKVGLGLPFFKMAAQMTGGDLTIQSQVGQGTTVTAWFGRSHIDRMPLGDIAGTMSCLIGANPQVDFIYRHTVDGEAFTADTRQFREILGDVPLSNPEVVQFIKEYIEENSRNLTGTPC